MQKFRKLDIFKKVPSDLNQKTNLGGAISILITITAIYFIIAQIQRFFNQPHIANIILDDAFTRQQLIINIDIQFPRFPCEIISLDLQDQMMSHHPNIGSVKKFRLDSQGKFIDSDDFQLLRQPDPILQYQLVKNAFNSKYGCRLKGQFSVKEVPGNFHISSHPYVDLYIRLALDGYIDTLDVSHKIHYLFFGNHMDIAKLQSVHPGTQLTPLYGHKSIYDMQTPHSYVSHYHIDIVPTLYKQTFSKTRTYQYTYNQNSFQVDHMPALYFNYHIGGTQIYFTRPSSAFSIFLLNMCAVIGGIYALGAILYRFLDSIFASKFGYQELGQ